MLLENIRVSIGAPPVTCHAGVRIVFLLLSGGHHGSTGPNGHAGNSSVLTTCPHAAGVRQRLLDSESGSGAMESMDRDLSYLPIGKMDET